MGLFDWTEEKEEKPKATPKPKAKAKPKTKLTEKRVREIISEEKSKSEETRLALIKMFRYALNGHKQYKRLGCKDTAEFEALFIKTLYEV